MKQEKLIGKCFCLVFFAKGFAPMDKDSTLDKEIFHNIISRTLFQLKSSESSIYFIKFEGILFVLIADIMQEKIRPLIKNLSEKVSDISLASSEVFYDVNKLPDAILSSLMFASYAKFVEMQAGFIDEKFYEEFKIELKKKYPGFYLQNYERQIISSIMNGNVVRASMITKHFFVSHLFDEISLFPTTFYNIKNILRLIMALVSVNPKELFLSNTKYESIMDRVEGSANISEMLVSLNDFFDITADYLKSNKEVSITLKKVEGIVAFIDENYKNCMLCEELLCEKFNISVSYLSRLFKENIGVNLSTYIQMIRIDEAKKMLTSTDYTIDEIAKDIGYSGGQTLLRLFKKHVGMTPSAFKILAKSNK